MSNRNRDQDGGFPSQFSGKDFFAQQYQQRPTARAMTEEEQQTVLLRNILDELHALRSDLKTAAAAIDTYSFVRLDDDYRRLTAEFRRAALAAAFRRDAQDPWWYFSGRKFGR